MSADSPPGSQPTEEQSPEQALQQVDLAFRVVLISCAVNVLSACAVALVAWRVDHASHAFSYVLVAFGPAMATFLWRRAQRDRRRRLADLRDPVTGELPRPRERLPLPARVRWMGIVSGVAVVVCAVAALASSGPGATDGSVRVNAGAALRTPAYTVGIDASWALDLPRGETTYAAYLHHTKTPYMLVAVKLTVVPHDASAIPALYRQLVLQTAYTPDWDRTWTPLHDYAFPGYPALSDAPVVGGAQTGWIFFLAYASIRSRFHEQQSDLVFTANGFRGVIRLWEYANARGRAAAALLAPDPAPSIP